MDLVGPDLDGLHFLARLELALHKPEECRYLTALARAAVEGEPAADEHRPGRKIARPTSQER